MCIIFFFFFLIGKKWVYLERNRLPRQSVGHLRRLRGPYVPFLKVFTKFITILFLFYVLVFLARRQVAS